MNEMLSCKSITSGARAIRACRGVSWNTGVQGHQTDLCCGSLISLPLGCRSALGASRSSGSTGLISKRWIFPGSSPTDQTTEKTWEDTAAEKNQTPDGVTIPHPGGAKIELHVPKTVGCAVNY